MTAALLTEPVRADACAAAQPRLDIRHVMLDDSGPHPSAANGVHHVARMIAREQIAAGDSARILILRRPGQPGEVASQEPPTTILPLTGRMLAGRVVALSADVMAALASGAGENTVFHLHTARHPLLPALARDLHRSGLPFGITVHGRYSHVVDRHGTVGNWRSAVYLRLLERSALERARFVQALSCDEADLIRRFAPRADISIVPNAAYSSAIDGVPDEAPRMKDAGRVPTFGYCGRYEIVHKGLDLLIEGFAAYRRAGGAGRLSMIGTGPARAVLIAAAQAQGVAPFVEIHGPRFGDDKRRLMQGWDFFVQPSRFDGVPIGALEAALGGLPLIVSVETGLAGPITDAGAGFVIGDLSAPGIADALAAAASLTAQARSRMAERAHAMTVAIGDWTRIAQSLRRLYLPP